MLSEQPLSKFCSLTVMLTLSSSKERTGELTCVQHTSRNLNYTCTEQTKERNPLIKGMVAPRDTIVATIISFRITKGSSSPQRVHVLWLRSYWASRNGEIPVISDVQLSTRFHPHCNKSMSATCQLQSCCRTPMTSGFTSSYCGPHL